MDENPATAKPDKKESRAPAADSLADSLAEGFRTVANARARFKLFWIRAIPVIATIYGAVALKPYYFFLGIAAIILLRYVERKPPFAQS